MFGSSTFQLRFDDDDDDDDGEEQFFESNQNLPATLDHSHSAMSSTVSKHRPKILLPIVPDTEALVTPAQLPVIVKTADKLLPRPPARPVVCPPRELPSPTTREFLPSPFCHPLEGSLFHMTSWSVGGSLCALQPRCSGQSCGHCQRKPHPRPLLK